LNQVGTAIWVSGRHTGDLNIGIEIGMGIAIAMDVHARWAIPCCFEAFLGRGVSRVTLGEHGTGRVT
jgi:hypothetical protein